MIVDAVHRRHVAVLNTSRPVEASGIPGFMLDFGKLPRVLADEVTRQLGHPDYTVVRTHLFGSYADNVDPRDADPVQRRLNFFGMLRQQHHYEVEAFLINFRGNRLRKTDRRSASTFEPKEKCVDIALATSMLFKRRDAERVRRRRRRARRPGLRRRCRACADWASARRDRPSRHVRDIQIRSTPQMAARLDLDLARDLLPEARAALRPARARVPVRRSTVATGAQTTYYPKRARSSTARTAVSRVHARAPATTGRRPSSR